MNASSRLAGTVALGVSVSGGQQGQRIPAHIPDQLCQQGDADGGMLPTGQHGGCGMSHGVIRRRVVSGFEGILAENNKISCRMEHRHPGLGHLS